MSRANTSIAYTDTNDPFQESPNKLRLKILADKLAGMKIERKEEVQVVVLFVCILNRHSVMCMKESLKS